MILSVYLIIVKVHGLTAVDFARIREEHDVDSAFTMYIIGCGDVIMNVYIDCYWQSQIVYCILNVNLVRKR